jgi:hypothetical protein
MKNYRPKRAAIKISILEEVWEPFRDLAYQQSTTPALALEAFMKDYVAGRALQQPSTVINKAQKWVDGIGLVDPDEVDGLTREEAMAEGIIPLRFPQPDEPIEAPGAYFSACYTEVEHGYENEAFGLDDFGVIRAKTEAAWEWLKDTGKLGAAEVAA